MNRDTHSHYNYVHCPHNTSLYAHIQEMEMVMEIMRVRIGIDLGMEMEMEMG